MGQVQTGDAGRETTASKFARSMAPQDGHIWVITGGDYENKEVFDDAADIDGMSGKIIIFGRGVFSGFKVDNCELYGQGKMHTIILDAIEYTLTGDDEVGDLVEGDVVSYAAWLEQCTAVENMAFRNAGGDTADVSAAMWNHQGLCIMDSVICTAALGDGTQQVDMLCTGTGAVFAHDGGFANGGGGAVAIRNCGAGTVILQMSLVTGSTVMDTAAGNIVHGPSVCVSGTQVGAGYFFSATGVLNYIDSLGVVQDISAHFEGIFNP